MSATLAMIAMIAMITTLEIMHCKLYFWSQAKVEKKANQCLCFGRDSIRVESSRDQISKELSCDTIWKIYGWPESRRLIADRITCNVWLFRYICICNNSYKNTKLWSGNHEQWVCGRRDTPFIDNHVKNRLSDPRNHLNSQYVLHFDIRWINY